MTYKRAKPYTEVTDTSIVRLKAITLEAGGGETSLIRLDLPAPSPDTAGVTAPPRPRRGGPRGPGRHLSRPERDGWAGCRGGMGGRTGGGRDREVTWGEREEYMSLISGSFGCQH